MHGAESHAELGKGWPFMKGRERMGFGYLEEIGRPESAHPEEATLGRSLPHAREEVKDVRLGGRTLEAENLVVV